jgi:hypothetical protein
MAMIIKPAVFGVVTSVIWYRHTNVSEEHAASIFREEESNSRLNDSIAKGVEVDDRGLI